MRRHDTSLPYPCVIGPSYRGVSGVAVVRRPPAAVNSYRRFAATSQTKEREGDDGDAVWASIRVRASVNDHKVAYGVTKMVSKPVQVPDVVVANGCAELDFDPHRLTVGAFDDEVNFAVTTACAEVTSCCVECLRAGSHAERGE